MLPSLPFAAEVKDSARTILGEWGTTIRAWPPSTSAKGSFPYDAALAPAAFRQLLLARAAVAPSGAASLEYDLAMLGFAWLQTLFDDYWTLARSACGLAPGGGVIPAHPGAANSTTALPCPPSAVHPLPVGVSQRFIKVPGETAGTVQLRLDDEACAGLCVDSSCYTGSCHPAKLLPCDVGVRIGAAYEASLFGARHRYSLWFLRVSRTPAAGATRSARTGYLPRAPTAR